MVDAASYTVERFRPGVTADARDRRDKRDIGGTLQNVPPVSRLSFRMFRELRAAMAKKWLVKDLLGAGEQSFIYGAPGSGKSVLVGDLACHVAAGIDWQGQRVTQGAVLYIAAERGAVVERRFAAWRDKHGIDDIPLALMTGAFDLWSNQVDTSKILATLEDIKEAAGMAVSWIIIDTVAAVTLGSDENTSRDMGNLVRNLRRLGSESGAHVTCIHHVPHADQSRMRGSGVLLGDADTTLSVEHDAETGVRTLRTRKANDGRDNLEFSFELEPLVIYTDPETGDETTAPVVVHRDMAGHSGTRKNVPLTHAEELARRALETAILEKGIQPPLRLGLSLKSQCVTEDEWRSYCYNTKITDSDNPSTRRKTFARAADGLQRKGRIGVREGFVWLT